MNEINILKRSVELIQSIDDKDKIKSLITELITKEFELAVVGIFDVNGSFIENATISSSNPLLENSRNLLTIPLSKIKFDLDDPSNAFSRSVKKGTYIITSEVDDFTPKVPLPVGVIKTGLKSLMGIYSVKYLGIFPCFFKSQLYSCIIVGNKSQFSENQITVLKLISDQVASYLSFYSLTNNLHYQIGLLQSQNKDLSSLYNLTSLIGQSLDPSIVAQTAVNALPQDEGMLGAILSLYHADTHQLIPRATSQNELSRRAQGLIGDFGQYKIDVSDLNNKGNLSLRAFVEKKPVYSNSISDFTSPIVSSKFSEPLANILQMQSVVVYPIIIHNFTIGTLAYFLKNKSFEELEENQKQLLQTYTTQIAIALENAELFKTSQQVQASLQKALLELQEARRRERDMIDIMGHELRTPITIARNALLILDEEQKKTPEHVTPDQQKYLDMSIESIRREISLIETLLSATKIDASRMQLNLTKVDMLDVVNDSIEGQKELAEEKQLNVKFNPPAGPIFGFADRTRIQEVVDNFLSNAVKYTPKGEVTIDLWQDGDVIWTSVKDQGIGIDSEDLQSLGRKFFRAKQYVHEDATQSGQNAEIVRPGGTGLGLYVTFDLIRMLGGKLYINSEVGKGSSFTFSIPTYADQPEQHIESTFSDDKKESRSHIIINSYQIPHQQ